VDTPTGGDRLSIERLKTFVWGLDDALAGGIPTGYVVLISGAPGTMKSSFAYSIAYNNVRGNDASALYVTLEQSRGTLLQQMNEMGMVNGGMEGLRVLDLGIVRQKLKQLKAKDSWISLFQMFAENLMESDDYEVLVLDSLNVLEALAQFENRRQDLFEFFEWLRDLDVTTLVVSERPTPSDPTAMQPDEAFLADGILSLTLHPVTDVDIQRRLRCVKMRSTPHETGFYALVWDGGKFEVTRAVSGSVYR
jgi:KaiC/GvpD/RAD55 family RecA-like ATPase